MFGTGYPASVAQVVRMRSVPTIKREEIALLRATLTDIERRAADIKEKAPICAADCEQIGRNVQSIFTLLSEMLGRD